MQGTITPLLCSTPFPTSTHHKNRLVSLLRILLPLSLSPSSPLQSLPFKPLRTSQLFAVSPLNSTATEEIVETAISGLEFVEVGYISSVHGLQGEVCVKSSTDFPELRFSKPGRRWLRQLALGKENIKEVQLVEGRGQPGKKSWILKFEGIDSVDQAKLLVGSTLLVREDERPELEDGEFYTRDLVGMRVILKETGECIGNVVNVYDNGGNDLLHVMLNSTIDKPDRAETLKLSETAVSGPLVWVPFVEAIVPDVDMIRREMWITPPKGLLELNIRSDERSKKERRQLEWKERKKLQRRLIAAKKKLCEMEQKHVFHGLRYGEKSQRSMLADQIMNVQSKLLQQALQNIETPSKRWSASELISATKGNFFPSLKISRKCISVGASEKTLGPNSHLREKGLRLLSAGRVAVVYVVKDVEKGECYDPNLVDSESTTESIYFIKELLCSGQTFVKIEDRMSLPLVFICPSEEVELLRSTFADNEYFGLDLNKVWFLEEEKLPVLSNSVEEQKSHKILMKSPWEVLQSPVGSGGVMRLLSLHDIPEKLSEMGVEYIEIRSSSHQEQADVNSMLLGFVESRKAEIGILVSEVTDDLEENFDVIFSTNAMLSLAKQIDKLTFEAITKPNAHVELVAGEWMDIVPSLPNSYELQSSIYSSLNAFSPDRVCIMEVCDIEA